MDHEETGCQAPPEGPILCVNNCGFFGSAATMNMCSKCHKDSMMKQEQAKLAASSFGRNSRGKEPIAASGDVQANSMDAENIFKNAEFDFKPEHNSSSVFAFKTDQSAVAKVGSESFPFATGASAVAKPGLESFTFGRGLNGEANPEGPKRCTACNKRVGLTGFNCRCGDHFCALHRYSDKHDCPYDYRTAGRDAIAEANPVVKAEKLEKI